MVTRVDVHFGEYDFLVALSQAACAVLCPPYEKGYRNQSVASIKDRISSG